MVDLGPLEAEAEPAAVPAGDAPVLQEPQPFAEPEAPAPGRNWDFVLITLALAGITALVYANALHDALVVDDASFPPQPDKVSLASLLQVFREDVWAAVHVASGVYRPLALVLLQLESLVFQAHLWAYHLTVVAAHVATTVMLFVLIREVLRQWAPPGDDTTQRAAWPAWLAALAFGVHPIHTEAVDSIFNGSEVLATLGVVSALWMIATRRRRAAPATWFTVSVVYLAAMLCKESSVTLPALAVLVLLPPTAEDEKPTWRRVLPVGWLAMPLAVAAALRYRAIGLTGVTATQGVSAAHAIGVGWANLLELQLSSLRDFSRMIVWPHPLRASYDDYVAGGMLSAVVILGIVVAGALLLWRRSPAISIGLAFFYVALLPSSRLFSHLGIVVTLAERYVYLPSVGAALALAGGLEWSADGHRTLPWVIGAPACFLLAFVTVGRNQQWGSDIALWEADVAAAPQNGDAWKWLTAAYMNAGQMKDVTAICDHELPTHPASSGFQANCGSAYLMQGRRSDAEAAFRSAAGSGNGALPHVQLARLLVSTRRTAAAEAEYDAAVVAEGDDVRRLTIRGEQLRRLHPDRLDEAQAIYEAALAIDPRFDPARLGLKYLEQTRSSTHGSAAPDANRE